MASGAGKAFNFVFWLLVLIFVSFLVAAISFPFYLLFSVLAPCCGGLDGVSALFLKLVAFPSTCSKNMVQRNSYDSV